MLCGAGQLDSALRGAACVALALAGLARPVIAQDAMPAPMPPVLAPSGPVLPVPSGVAVQWLETLSDSDGPAGLTYRFRFVAPQIGRGNSGSGESGAGPGYGPEAASADLAALCESYALPNLPATGPQPAELVLDLADRAVPFGQADEMAVQYFEAYSIVDGACVWELF